VSLDLPIIEPFRIKSVEPIRMTTRAEREASLDKAKGNLFLLSAEEVLIDLLTDSGTGAMSSEQWAAVMRGDESYAGSPSFRRFEAAVRETLGLEQVIPTHQGRAAEHLLFQHMLRPGDIVPNNTHFDTTRANIEDTGATALDLPCAESRDTQSMEPFKGNMNIDALRGLLATDAKRIPLVMITVTNNAGGGQPVSLENMRGVKKLCDQRGIPLYIDACRFAENAHLVLRRETGMRGRTVPDIVHEMFSLADGCTMSAKKDGLANIGGFLALRDEDMASELRQRLVVTEGFPTYGGMSGRDLDAIAQGLREVVDPAYLDYRLASISYVVDRLAEHGVPVVQRPGGHAVFLDADRFLSHLPWNQFPGQALAIELYLEGGIRSCEIGSLMLARTDQKTGEELPAEHELVRLAVPRRTYTQSHMDYVIAIIRRVWERRDEIRGVALAWAPRVLRHFSAHFRRV
jgi:tryptophanase